MAIVVITAIKPNPSSFPRNTEILAPPRISFTKPSLIVKTESNVWKEERKKPRPCCLLCGGSGRVDCHHCHGKGCYSSNCGVCDGVYSTRLFGDCFAHFNPSKVQSRTNCADSAMLPKGEWPKWCKTCGGSGLGFCNRCMGSGEYRDIIGFNFMNVAKRSGFQDKKL